MSFLFLVLMNLSHATTFDSRVLVVAKETRTALLSLADLETIAFAQCVVPDGYDLNAVRVPLDLVLGCRLLGKILPNTDKIRLALENNFKTELADRIAKRTGVLGALHRTLPVGAAFGSLISAFVYAITGRFWWGAGVGAASVVAAGTGGVIAHLVSDQNASSDRFLLKVHKSALLSLLQPPLATDDMNDSEVGRDGFDMARRSLLGAIEKTDRELHAFHPGGGSSGGGGATGTW